jgi:hypothetical protein
MEVLIVWLVLSVLVGVWAGGRGRSGFGYFALSIVLSPLIGFLIVAATGNLKVQANEPSPDTHVRCPDCRELVLRDARKCKHCGTALIPQ